MVTIIVSKSESQFFLKIVGDQNRDIFTVGTIFPAILTLFTSNGTHNHGIWEKVNYGSEIALILTQMIQSTKAQITSKWYWNTMQAYNGP